jgi:hypothetical protein
MRRSAATASGRATICPIHAWLRPTRWIVLALFAGTAASAQSAAPREIFRPSADEPPEPLPWRDPAEPLPWREPEPSEAPAPCTGASSRTSRGSTSGSTPTSRTRASSREMAVREVPGRCADRRLRANGTGDNGRGGSTLLRGYRAPAEGIGVRRRLAALPEGSISEGLLQYEAHEIISDELDAVLGDRRAQDILAQGLSSRGIPCARRRCGVQREAERSGAPRLGVNRLGDAAQLDGIAPAQGGTGGERAGGGRHGELGECGLAAWR